MTGLESWNFIRKLLWPMAISIPILVLPSGELSKKLRFKVPVDSNGGQKVKWPLFSQTASILHFWPGNWLHPFWPENPKEGGFRVSPKPTFQFYCGKPEVDKGKILVGTGRPSGVFHPWKYGKGRIRTGEKLGVQFWGSKCLITPALFSKGKTLEAFKKAFAKVPSQTNRAFNP